MLHRNAIPACRKKNKDTNRYLIQKIHIMYIFFLFLEILALVTAAYNVYHWVKGDRKGFANSKASAVSELVSIQEMSSSAEKLNCWNEIQKRSWTHINSAQLKPCPCASAEPKSCQELCWIPWQFPDHAQALASAPHWHSEISPIPLPQKSQCGPSGES